MFRSFLVVLLFLVPVVSADTELHMHSTNHGGTVAGLAYVHDGTTVQTHQNMELRVEAGERTWFVTDNLHEHDGITTFHTGLHGATTLTVQGDEMATNDIQEPSEGPVASPDVDVTDGTVQLQADGPVVGEWVARNDLGVLARGWFDTASDSKDLVTINVDGTHSVEVRPVGAEPVTVTVGPITAENALRSIPPEDDPTPCGMDVRVDPPEVLTGRPARITVGDLADKPTVSYRLVQDVDVVNQYAPLTWTSTAPGGASAFRVPAAGIYTLHVDAEDGPMCALTVNASEGTSESLAPEWTFQLEGDDLVFTTTVEGTGHYEFPVWLSHDDGTTTSLVWAGKLHSHGGPVAFTVPDASPGDYTVRFDAAPQGDAPIVPSATGWSKTVTIASDDPGDEAKSTPAPLGLLALLAVALLARRR